ncbi:lysis protein, partial [Pseudomonas sp. WS 5079]|nr:lysis protein [Pseudomonas sp. WS 5079]
MTPVQKLAGLVVLILALMASAAGVTWQVQEWRTGKTLAEQAGLHQDELDRISAVAIKQVRDEQDRRLGLEKTLATSDQQHTRELSDAQR